MYWCCVRHLAAAQKGIEPCHRKSLAQAIPAIRDCLQSSCRISDALHKHGPGTFALFGEGSTSPPCPQDWNPVHLDQIVSSGMDNTVKIWSLKGAAPAAIQVNNAGVAIIVMCCNSTSTRAMQSVAPNKYWLQRRHAGECNPCRPLQTNRHELAHV